jgi:hypothetical protein
MLESEECTFQQDKNDPNKIMKSSKEEWDQSTYDYQIIVKTVESWAENAKPTSPVTVPDLFDTSKLFTVLALRETK